MARRLSNYLVAFAFAAPAAARCEVLRSLEFQQHTAPKGVSELLGPVVSLVSEKAAEVGDIKIRWDGELGLHTTYGLVAAVALALALITVIVASNAQTASAATARANTPIKVVSYQSLAPEQVEKAAYRSPFDSPTI